MTDFHLVPSSADDGILPSPSLGGDELRRLPAGRRLFLNPFRSFLFFIDKFDFLCQKIENYDFAFPPRRAMMPFERFSHTRLLCKEGAFQNADLA